MPVSMPVTTKITQNSTRSVKQRALSASFGDGYSQTAPNGVNSKYEEWSVSWGLLNSTERASVIAALEAVGTGDYLSWTPPGQGSSKKFMIVPNSVLELYSEQILAGQYYNITTNLRQVF